MGLELTQIESEIKQLQADIVNHQVFQKIKTLDGLCKFLEGHVYAVWDFMSLLKAIQKNVTYPFIPWRPSSFDKNLVRIINEIVLEEESDLIEGIGPIDHFTLYLDGMVDVGANVNKILHACLANDLSELSSAENRFVSFHFDLAKQGNLESQVGAFFFARESLIPSMFTAFLENLTASLREENFMITRRTLLYFKRHIEIDGGKHRDLSKKVMEIVCGGDSTKQLAALVAARDSLLHRKELWDDISSRF